MSSLVETVTALDPETMVSGGTIFAPGLHNVATNWYNGGVMVSNVTESVVLAQVAYDALRRETARIDGRGNVSRTRYDAFGRVAETIDALTNATAYAYDAMGRVAAVTNALGETTEYAYDTRGNRIAERGATYPVDYTYDAYGNKIAMTTYRTVGGVIPNAPQQGDTTHWFYDESSCTLTNKLYADGQGPCYEYDANGRLTKRTWARGVETFYAYDGWGNLTNTTYSDNTPTIALRYDALGRQVEAHDAAGVTTFTYDDYGALTNETVIGVAGTNVIERYYDTFGRNAGYALNGIRQTALAYDPATGRLVSMSVPTGEEESNHSTPTPSTYTYFIWDLTEPVATRPLVWFNSALDTPHSALSYTHDGNKNVSEVIANNVSIAAHYEYAPFGAVTAQSGALAMANPWRFSSEFADDELGCDYYNYREYEPLTGRWLSMDPIGELDSVGLFVAFNNSPIVSEDVLGLEVYAKICRDAIYGVWEKKDSPLKKWFCEEEVCSEIKAYSGADCVNHSGDLKKVCVKNGAKRSSKRFAPCKNHNVDQLVEAAVNNGTCK